MKKTFILIPLLALTLVTAACGQKQSATPASTPPASNAAKPEAAVAAIKATDPYPNAALLADVKWTEEHLKDGKVKIFDTRAKGYEQGHIPGAYALNSGLLKDSANNTIASKEKITELFQGLGVNSDTTVLLYDEGNSLNASRVFYALEYYGLKDHVKVLNGGYAAWSAAAKEVSTDTPPAPVKGNFAAVPNDKLVTTKEQLKALNLQQCVLLDVRSAKEYSGEDLRGNKKGGHIDKAVNREWSDAIDANSSDGVPRFKNYQELSKAFDQTGVDKSKTIVPYCQTNIRGAHTYFTLRLLGYSDVRPYEGAFAEWGNADDTTVVK
ncbi:sulfurtransferase [Paenibacillus radicis (ex Xue et al. 2023)]|uniref:Sulfurtransferase n=1 Tax=Paenibacillus radicis (ex Xue et al. 2023) TaxID=2972489 RepID=A0ABT1YU18_9BACL|nr:sulfurtransferase [Paenibacillus radicis (ex Xue et al. 2023)]MCR8636669.1 sulfurtransferase [Paenibacillus radicis (ex Xue et al. 2023)]